MKSSTRKAIVRVLFLWGTFSLISMLNASYVNDVGYVAHQYGFPFTWLVQVYSSFSVGSWTFFWYPALLDFSSWLLVSLVVVLASSRTRHFFSTVFPIAISIPFFTVLSFDPFLVAVGLTILAGTLVAAVLQHAAYKSHDISRRK